MNILVIHELDKENSVIGVSDSIENAEKIISEYYGKDNYKEVSYTDIRDSNLEYSKVLEIKSDNTFNSYKVQITLEWFSLNEV